jgi:hypothetical protein
MEGYTQLLNMLIERYDLTEQDAKKRLDRCLFDQDVMIAILNRAEELELEC